MKLAFILLILSFNIFASTSDWQNRWWGIQEIVDKHSFYKEEQTIDGPANSVQALVGFLYYSKDFKVYKDCLGFEIPSAGEIGSVFVVTTSSLTPCDEVIVTGKRETGFLAKSLSYKTTNSKLTLQYTDEKFRSKEIIFKFFLPSQNKKPELFESSVHQVHGRSLIVLSSNDHSFKQPTPKGKWEDAWHSKDLVSCQSVNDDCQRSASTCDQCRFGFFEVSNGCVQGGPRYCGVDLCGEKGMPACPRGSLYQNGEVTQMDCRTDQSFVFCQKGLRIRCQGSLAICD